MWSKTLTVCCFKKLEKFKELNNFKKKKLVQDINKSFNLVFWKTEIQVTDIKWKFFKENGQFQTKKNKHNLSTDLNVIDLKFLDKVKKTNIICLKEDKY